MKYYIYFFLLSLSVINTCCSKEVEPNNNAVTSYYFNHDEKWNKLDSGLSFHWHNVDQQTLKQFEGKLNDTLCNTVMTYRVHKDECKY